MIEDQPEEWGHPLKDYYDRWIGPLTPLICQAPGCVLPTVGSEEYCRRHLLEVDKAFEEWLDWKDEQRHDLD